MKLSKKSATRKSEQSSSQSSSQSSKQSSDELPNSFFGKIFGALKMSWPAVIALAAIMGIYTALMAMLVPDGNSFHDIAVTPEWWILPALFIVINCKKPLDAALKVFVFFLISQPLVYLVQVPFSEMGWGLFNYYPYWFVITLATIPAAFVCWFIKKNQWYSGIILGAITGLLAYFGIDYVRGMSDYFPNHLLTTIYCFAAIPFFILVLLKKWQPRLIAATITTICAVIVIATSNFGSNLSHYETYTNTFLEDNNITLVGTPTITSEPSENGADVMITGSLEDSYMFKISGDRDKEYYFSLTDESGKTYNFVYFYDTELQTITVKARE